MSSRGIIYLYDSDSNLPISVKKYADRVKRRNIIENWRKIYAGAFYRCYVIISPELNEDFDYDAIEKRLDRETPKLKKISIKRHKSENKGIYNVQPLYDYDD